MIVRSPNGPGGIAAPPETIAALRAALFATLLASSAGALAWHVLGLGTWLAASMIAATTLSTMSGRTEIDLLICSSLANRMVYG